MEQDEIVRELSKHGVKKLTTETRIGTYLTTNRSSLVAQQVSNRSSADWKKAQYVLINKSDGNTPDLDACIDGWRSLAQERQFLIIYDKGEWKYYDCEGNQVPFEQLIPGNNHFDNVQRPRQIIYYGAPGTGKSHKIKELLKGISKENIFRTTFHPDSDYSSFVGAYKPTKAKKPLYGLNGGLTVRLNDGKEDIDEEIITYKFIPQAFLNAYMQAYRKPAENVYLIIEEINRGNCAQIFGDLFQLLDRDENGVSEYSIKADADLRTFLEEELGEDSDAIKNGELCLPDNLYIYATMNTSDQSLFPIDSAFKRRWDWEYEPIKYMNTSWAIDIDDIKYSWVSFQKEVNTRIFDLTHSEDKMLGDFFVNPADGIIKADLFRNKVLFYLWNDVCKDGEGDIFRISDEEEIKFSELYGDDGDNILVAMMEYLHIADLPSIKNIDVNKDGNLSGNNSKDKTRFTLNGDDNNGRGYSKGGVAYEAVKLFCSQHPQMTADDVMTKWLSLQIIGANLVETQEVYNKRTSGSTDSRLSEKSKIVTLQNGEQLYVTNQFDLTRINDFIQKVNAQNWGIDIQKFN